jgi:HSP20 family molecular chaperone IbpA
VYIYLLISLFTYICITHYYLFFIHFRFSIYFFNYKNIHLVNIDRGFLELKAERKQVHREDDGFSRRIERSFGRVSRRLALPPQADQNQVVQCSVR